MFIFKSYIICIIIKYTQFYEITNMYSVNLYLLFTEWKVLNWFDENEIYTNDTTWRIYFYVVGYFIPNLIQSQSTVRYNLPNKSLG